MWMLDSSKSALFHEIYTSREVNRQGDRGCVMTGKTSKSLSENTQLI
jgi:hypothetical protein